jgi:hypothetical protein
MPQFANATSCQCLLDGAKRISAATLVVNGTEDTVRSAQR